MTINGGQFLLSSSGTANGSGFDDVEGSFIDPATITTAADMAAADELMMVETRASRDYLWLAIPKGQASPLRLDLTPIGDHTGRPSGNIAPGKYTLVERINGIAMLPSVTARQIEWAHHTTLQNYNNTIASDVITITSSGSSGIVLGREHRVPSALPIDPPTFVPNTSFSIVFQNAAATYDGNPAPKSLYAFSNAAGDGWAYEFGGIVPVTSTTQMTEQNTWYKRDEGVTATDGLYVKRPNGTNERVYALS